MGISLVCDGLVVSIGVSCDISFSLGLVSTSLVNNRYQVSNSLDSILVSLGSSPQGNIISSDGIPVGWARLGLSGSNGKDGRIWSIGVPTGWEVRGWVVWSGIGWSDIGD